MSEEIVDIQLKFNPENGDLQVKSNCDPTGLVALLEMAKHQVLQDSLGDGFSKMSR